VDPVAILNALIGSGPVAAVLFYWVWQERKERRELQALLLQLAQEQIKQGKATRLALLKRKPEDDDDE